MGAVIVRVLLSLVFIAGAAGAAFVFEACAAGDSAASLGRLARNLPAGAERAQVMSAAKRALDESWAAPLAWNGGALETASWLAALDIAADDRHAMRVSREFAERALAHAPMQASAWTRLAALGLHGEPSALCAPAACLAASFQTAPVAQATTACERLQVLAATQHLTVSTPAIGAYLAAEPLEEDASQCLAFLSPGDRFSALLSLQLAKARARLVRRGATELPLPP